MGMVQNMERTITIMPNSFIRFMLKTSKISFLMMLLVLLPLILGACGGDDEETATGGSGLDMEKGVENAENIYLAINARNFDELDTYLCEQQIPSLQEGITALDEAGIVVTIDNVFCEASGDNILCDYTVAIVAEDKTYSRDYTDEVLPVMTDKRVCGTSFVIPTEGFPVTVETTPEATESPAAE
jgi:hypothetical protein